MNELELMLHRTRKTVWQACEDLGIPVDQYSIASIDSCASCGIWEKHSKLRPDLDGNPICKECFTFYGL